MRPTHHRRRLRAMQWLAWGMASVMLLRATTSGAAAYAPGEAEADPPTGDVGMPLPAPAPSSPVAGNGIRWTFGPLRMGGRVSLEGRWLQLEDGTRTNQGVLYNDIEWATHVWQPWFIQLRGGVGALYSRDTTQPPQSPSSSHDSVALTGRLSMMVFPASRFPFELRAEVGDSRAGGDSLGNDTRSYRLGMNQSYRSPSGKDTLALSVDRSRLSSDRWGTDTVSALTASVLRYLGEQTVEVTANVVENERSDSSGRSRYAALTGRHSARPTPSMNVDTLASWTDSDLRAGDFRFRSDLRQISSFATWRPRKGEPLYSEQSPLYLTGSARLQESTARSASLESRAQAFNATLGLNQELTREVRLGAAVSGTLSRVDDADTSRIAAVSLSSSYSPDVAPWGDWRYTPALSGNVGWSDSSALGMRRVLGAQFNHGIGRSVQFGEAASLSLHVTQSLGAVRESESEHLARTMAHAAGLYWQAAWGGRHQSMAGLSLSDARNEGDARGRFQLVNLQLSQRMQASRYSSLSGNFTFQANRSSTTQIDALNGLIHTANPGWQRFYSGSLNYEHQRAFDIPRLRMTVLFSANSQQFEQRLLGDVDAPRERISQSLEARLDYAVGRLETRLSARSARVDGRRVTGVFARVQRNY